MGESEIADFCLAMGSSLTVTPACAYAGWVATSTKQRFYGHLPSDAQRGSLAIINIQKTPYDADAVATIHAFCDDVMRELMDQLGLVVEENDTADMHATNELS